MDFPTDHIERIKEFGYTESEARFLYIVAVHSGYFTLGQFRAFTGTTYGKRPTSFAEKVLKRGHATIRITCAGAPAVTIRDLLKASLRHRPDRIILGEIRGGEAFDLLQLLNTGHSGSLSTVHATSARQGLARFTSCVLQSGVDLPYRAIKTNVGDSVNVVVHLERRPGRRFVSEVVEIHGYDPERDEYNYSFIFDSHKEAL